MTSFAKYYVSQFLKGALPDESFTISLPAAPVFDAYGDGSHLLKATTASSLEFLIAVSPRSPEEEVGIRDGAWGESFTGSVKCIWSKSATTEHFTYFLGAHINKEERESAEEAVQHFFQSFAICN